MATPLKSVVLVTTQNSVYGTSAEMSIPTHTELATITRKAAQQQDALQVRNARTSVRYTPQGSSYLAKKETQNENYSSRGKETYLIYGRQRQQGS